MICCMFTACGTKEEEVKVDYEKLQKKQVIAEKRKQRGYEATNYKTIK